MLQFLLTILYCCQLLCDDELSTEHLVREAEQFFEQQEYSQAIDRYRKLLTRAPADLQNIFRLAFCYTALS